MKKLALISLAFINTLSLSVSAETLKDELTQCVKIQKSLARLACFDELAKAATTPAAIGTGNKKNTSTTVTTTVSTAKLAKEDSFGAEHLKKKNVSAEDLKVVFVVKSLKKNQYGKWHITFNNGQRWQQTDGIHFRIKVGESVLLKKGFMDAIYLKKNKSNSNKKIRVKRLK